MRANTNIVLIYTDQTWQTQTIVHVKRKRTR